MFKKLAFSLFSLTFTVSADALTVDNVQLSDNGRSIIIEGAGFGDGPEVAVYDTFDPPGIADAGSYVKAGLIAGSAIDERASELGSWKMGSYPGRYDTDAYSGSYSARLYKGNIGMQQIKTKFAPSQEVYISYWVKLSGGETFPGDHVDGERQFSKDSSWKFSWLIDKDYHGKSSDVCLPTHVGGGTFYLGGNGGNLVTSVGNEWWSWSHWMRISFWLKANELDPTAPGRIDFITRSQDKGYKKRTYQKPVFTSRGSPASDKAYRQVNFPGWIRSLQDDDTDVVYDDIYVAYGQGAVSRVEIANAKKYDEADKIFILPKKKWSETRIEAKMLGFLSNSPENMYIYITDKNGNVNNNGIPISQLNPSNVVNFSVK